MFRRDHLLRIFSIASLFISINCSLYHYPVPSTQLKPIQLYDHVINHGSNAQSISLNNIPGYSLPSLQNSYNSLEPQNVRPTQPPISSTQYGPPYYFGKSLPAINPYQHIDEVTYISHDGRVLKQYLVMEDSDDIIHNALDELLNNPGPNQGFLPYLPPNQNSRTNLGFPTTNPTEQKSSRLIDYSQFGRRAQFSSPPSNHGPIALGSGSLGYIQLPNGAVYLGSGSLGYIAPQQRAVEVSDARNRISPNASPVTFGKSPS